jgi:hypothetical protein
MSERFTRDARAVVLDAVDHAERSCAATVERVLWGGGEAKAG